jgi:hypothetical protein
MKKLILIITVLLSFNINAQNETNYYQGRGKVMDVSQEKAHVRLYSSNQTIWIKDDDFKIGSEYYLFIKVDTASLEDGIDAVCVYSCLSFYQNNLNYKKKADSIAKGLYVKRIRNKTLIYKSN